MIQHRPLRILLTGGTIDKVHDTQSEGLSFPETGESHIPGLLQNSRCHFPEITPVLQKDSLYFDDADRELILATVNDALETAIVITHGTGTMGETARFLAGRCPGKTVVLTGAMRPYSLGRSDAGFNIGGALIAAQILPEGVYGVMNGRAFAAAELNKNTQAGRFDL
ncbi:MAG: asparaginase domain-containing protein [Mangrovicoccus sp.]